MHEHYEALKPGAANHVPLSPVSFLTRAAEVHGDATAVVYGEVRRSWSETAARVRAIAGGLSRLGVGTGDTVAVLAPNLPELMELHFAVPMCGGVLCTINTRLEPETITYILGHSDSVLVIVDTEFRAVLDDALAGVSRDIPVVEIADPYGAGPAARDIPFESLLDDAPFEGDALPRDEWQAICLNYTSGTSGRPKGVVYHHRGAYLMAMGTVAGWQVPRHPAYLSVVPMFHCNGWGHPWMMALTGGKMVFVRPVEPTRIFAAIDAEGITHFGAAPIVLQMLAESSAKPAEPYDPPIQVMTAGAPPPPAVLERTSAVGLEVMHVYGLTETYGHIAQCQPQESWSNLTAAEQAERRARQGVAFPMVEALEVVDRDSGDIVPRDGETQGEIAIRGNTIMKGYYKDPEANDQAFLNGRFWSGDAAVVHADGYVQVRDRLKDVIISGGENVSSVEVEAVLYRHPDIQTAAVVAKPDAKWGEVPCAFVELREGTSLTESDVIAFCRERLAGFKTPKVVVFAEIPKTATGKVQKFQLRAFARQMS